MLDCQMKTPLSITTLLFLFLQLTPGAPPISVDSADWPWWRGPTRDGKAVPDQNPPLKFGDDLNVIWKTAVPDRSHSSPTIVGDRIFLATGDERSQTQSMVAFDRASGKQLWKTDVLKGSLPKKIHKKNSHATCTLACDGHLLFGAYYNDKSIRVCAVDLDGKSVWNTRVGDFYPQKYEFGYGASPILYKDYVIAIGDYEKGGFIAALDRATGGIKWKTKRPLTVNYSTPVVATMGGRDLLIASGGRKVSAYDPMTGKLLWDVDALTEATCGTPVWEGNMVFASGGYPKKETVGVRVSGNKAEVVWKNITKCYEQSLLVHKGHVYAFDDGGVLYCWRGSDGEVLWRERLGGPVSASPVLVGEHIYLSNEDGEHFVIKANPEKFELVAKNQLGEEGFATPTIIGGRIYARTAHGEDSGRKETLYCLGEK